MSAVTVPDTTSLVAVALSALVQSEEFRAQLAQMAMSDKSKEEKKGVCGEFAGEGLGEKVDDPGKSVDKVPGFVAEGDGHVSDWSDEVVEELEKKQTVEAAEVGDVGATSAGSEISDSDVSRGSVEIPGEFKAVDGPARAVTFGGIGDHYDGSGVSGEKADKGFFKNYVRTPAVKAFREFVEQKAGCKIPNTKMYDFALCSYTTATVPAAFVDGAKRLKQLMIIGDACLTFHVVTSQIAKGSSVASAQAIRSEVTSNSMLQSVCVQSGLASHFSFPGGVVPIRSKVSADALEAVLGYLALYRDPRAVVMFLRSMQLL